MGLDITAYGTAKLLPEGDCSEAKAGFGDEYVLANADEAFKPSAAGLQLDRWYECDRLRTLSFRAGSYSGYGIFRQELAKLAGYQPGDAWRDPEGHRDAPFYLLVNFSDCEGTIGPEAAQELEADFGCLSATARWKWVERPMFKLSYRQWWAAFTLASDTGLVELH